MTREEWARLQPLFHGALEQPPERRSAWLQRACPYDEALRREAVALIEAYDTMGTFLETPPALVSGSDPGVDPDPGSDPGNDPDLGSDPGDGATQLGQERRLGPYLVREELGRGGMGIVYLAEDVRLHRMVALKLLPPELADDAGKRERLRREARAAAALSHPGIAVVYALEEIDGRLAIVSEYISGHTLRSELAQGALGPDRALTIALEIARALCAAHEHGIIHRDLKPENILITREGRPKILDFGIAYVTGEAAALTMPGAVLGTPAYMAPEQLLGAHVDFRADIYSLGVLLVEMATGTHPLGAAAAAVLPPPLGPIVERSLAADPRQRYPSTRDLVTALEHAAIDPSRESVRRRASPEAESPDAAPPNSTGAKLSPRWWWEFHQGCAAVVYGLMMIPLWYARTLVGPVSGRVLFTLGLLGATVTAVLRLHLWFTSHFYPDELPWLRAKVTRWIAAADWIFALSLAAAGALVGDKREALAVTLLAVGIGSAVAFLVVEPVTQRAAFRRSA